MFLTLSNLLFGTSDDLVNVDDKGSFGLFGNVACLTVCKPCCSSSSEGHEGIAAFKLELDKQIKESTNQQFNIINFCLVI